MNPRRPQHDRDDTQETASGLDTSSYKYRALVGTLHEARALLYRVTAWLKELHNEGEMSAGKRGIMLNLKEFGELTVPEMARMRPVSRQHIQQIVNQLLDDGSVELKTNPAHKRSRFVVLTNPGRAKVDEMLQREARLIDELDLEVNETELAETKEVLRSLRKIFDEMPLQLLAALGLLLEPLHLMLL